MKKRLKIRKKNKIHWKKWVGLLGSSIFMLFIGIIIGLICSACASLVFPYKYYGLSSASYAGGQLLGPRPSDDVDLTDCQPTKQDARPCIVMFTKEFLPMKQDYLETKNALTECQRKIL